MATYRVIPLPDESSIRQNWQVQRNGRTVSEHLKKSAAKRRAEREASTGESIVIHRLDGTVQSSTTG